MVGLLIGLIVFALVAYLAWWLLNTLGAGLPQPVKVIITVLFVLICVVALLNYFPVDLPRGRFLH